MAQIFNIKADIDIVDALEHLLTKAKEGELTSIAYIVSTKESETGNGWAGMDKCNMAILGEIRILERDFVDMLIDTRINPETGEYNG